MESSPEKHPFADTKPASEQWLNRPQLAVALAVPLMIVLIYTFALIPGVHLPALANYLLDVGLAESIAREGLFSQPTHLGNPEGLPVLYGAPLTYLTAAVIKASGMTPVDARTVAGFPLYILSFVSCYALLRWLKVFRTVAVILTFAFFSNRFLWGHLGYGPLAPTFALIPAFVYLDLRLYARFAEQQRWRTGDPILLFLNLMLRIGVLLMEGYCFVIWSLISSVICGLLVLRHLRSSRYLAAATSVGVLMLFGAGPYFTYSLAVPGATGYAVMPIDFFRAQGVDLTSLLLPAPHTSLLFSRLGLAHTFDPYAYYGDGSNQSYNYIGISLLFCGIAALFCVRSVYRTATPLLIAGGCALVLSLGPSLKVGDTRPANPAHTRFTSKDYQMPPSAATLSLGTDILYQKAPGIKNMRAIYRWLILPKLVIVVLAAIFVSWIATQRLQGLSVLFLAAITIEMFPPVDILNRIYKSNRQQLDLIERDIVSPLKEVIPRGSKIAFVSQENDYLATYLAPRIDSFSYNTGGDKFQALAAATYSPELRAVLKGTKLADSAFTLMEKGQLDTVILPFFNLRWDSYRWPPSAESKKAAEDRMRALLPIDDPRFVLVESEYFFALKAATHPTKTE